MNGIHHKDIVNQLHSRYNGEAAFIGKPDNILLKI